MEKPPERKIVNTDEEPFLYFVLDGVKYALRQNAMSQEAAYEALKTWFPEVEILPNQLEED